jgi:hypothetical protein
MEQGPCDNFFRDYLPFNLLRIKDMYYVHLCCLIYNLANYLPRSITNALLIKVKY